MRRLLTAALAVIWATSGTNLQAMESGASRPSLPFWKPVGPWVVLLLPLPNGNFACTALTRAAPKTPRGYSIGLVLGQSSTHFYLNDPKLPRDTPGSITLSVDGIAVADPKVLLREPYDNGGQLLVADLPGDMLARRVLPAMVKGRTLEVTAGDRHYEMPIADFASVVRELGECAPIALAMQEQASARSQIAPH